ncbi:hypothetical protein PFLuk1_01171 [Pseudomonas fluorescens]|nr:hypothetical protein PFLuk1_01171 [Pseudomonas fluorescens]
MTSQSGELDADKEQEPYCPDAFYAPSILWSMSVAPKQIPPECKESAVEQGTPPSQIGPYGFECLLPGVETTQRGTTYPSDQCGGQDHHRNHPQTRKQSE